MTKRCEVFSFGSSLYIVTCLCTRAGVLLLNGPFSVILDCADDFTLGAICKKHFESSTTIDDPKNYNTYQTEFNEHLNHLGFKKPRDFFNRAKSLSLSANGSVITITPNKQMRHRDQYDLIVNEARECCDETSVIGMTVRDRLKFCTLYKS